jgi:hypothetical protein
MLLEKYRRAAQWPPPTTGPIASGFEDRSRTITKLILGAREKRKEYFITIRSSEPTF